MSRLTPTQPIRVPATRMGRQAADAHERCALLCPAPDAAARLLSQAIRDAMLTPRPVRSAEELRDVLFDDVVAIAIVHFGRDIPRGVATCRSIRKHPSGERVPIIAVVDAAIIGDYPLDSGPDEVLITPVTASEAALRVRICLWRNDEPLQQASVKIGDLSIDFGAMRVRLKGVPVDLTYKEFELLRYFVQNPTTALRREQILESVWGDDYFGGDRTVDIHVRRLRAKIPPLGEYIETVHGVGYRFGAPPGTH